MTGDGLILQELLERGDPGFVDRLRGVADADALARFADHWYDHPSPDSRRLLLAYLERPLNAYRHEAMVKRLFKRAEADGDDAIMARFLVAFDRSIRRVKRTMRRLVTRLVRTRNEADRLGALWLSQGYESVSVWERSGGPPSQVSRLQTEAYLTTPQGTAMPRGRVVDWKNPRLGLMRILDWVGRLRLDPQRYPEASQPPESERGKFERFRLFSVPTRQYLRRRAWRYFRRLGKTHPDRYVAAIAEALRLYEDGDVPDGLALIDNWGLIHAMFHRSPVLVARARGWGVAGGRSLAELEPSPIYEDLWRSSPRALLDLMKSAGCRPVRRWAALMLSRHLEAIRASVGIEEVLGLLGSDDPEVVEFAVNWLRGADDLSSVSPDRWLAIAESASPGALEVLAEIMGRLISPERIAPEVAVRLASSRPLPLARLGLTWLKAVGPEGFGDRRDLLPLLEADCEPIRPEILAWLRASLASTPEFHADGLLEFLDSRHADARVEGMSWFRAEPRARDDVVLWQRLMESPYDDVRIALSADLDARLKRSRTDADFDLDPEGLRRLWASVLLNVNRGSRAKPGVLDQVADRLRRRPEEAEALLPILAIGLRSLRAPERRAALAAIVRLVEGRPEASALVGSASFEW